MTSYKNFDGSRRHVLDWIESPTYLDTMRSWVREQGLTIGDDPAQMPKSWLEPKESKLFNVADPFLTTDQRNELQKWWLAHKGNIPNWDLIVSATAHGGGPALILVEAKAHRTEFDCKPKTCSKRKTPDQQKRTEDNHRRIGDAIEKASSALRRTYPGVSISRNRCYQLSNRIATAWKLASLGIRTALIFLGFTGDREIKREGIYFADDRHWKEAFHDYLSPSFPVSLIGRDIDCGPASFRLIEQSLPVRRLSRPLVERRSRA